MSQNEVWGECFDKHQTVAVHQVDLPAGAFRETFASGMRVSAGWVPSSLRSSDGTEATPDPSDAIFKSAIQQETLRYVDVNSVWLLLLLLDNKNVHSQNPN